VNCSSGTPSSVAAVSLTPIKAGRSALRARFGGGGHFGAVARVMLFRAMTLVVNLGTGVLAAKHLGPDGRGELAALLVGPQFVGAVAMFGLPMAYIYNSKADPKNRRYYLGCALLLGLPLCLAAVAIGYIIMPFWLAGHDAATVRTARLLLFFVPVSVAIPLLTGVLDAVGRFGLSSSIQYLQPVGTLIGLVGIASVGRLTATTAAVAYILPTVLTCLCAAWQAGRFVRPAFSLAASFRHKMLTYGFGHYGVEVFGSLSSYVDQIVVVYLLSPAAVGVYVVALSLSRVLGVMQDVIWSVLFPNIAGRGVNEVVRTVTVVVQITVIVAGAVALAAGLLGPYVIALLYGRAFTSAATPFRILLAATVVTSAARLFGHMFSATGRPGIVTLIEAMGVFALLAAMTLLVPTFGASGAALAVLAGATVRLGCVLGFMRLVLRLPLPRLIPDGSNLQSVRSR
jgi:O-antigen/teichoic acid export membrane protein